MLHFHEQPNYLNLNELFNNLPLALLYFSNLTMAQEINNIHYTYLIFLSDFLQVLYGAREFPTKN
jgi:hypothetical protein